jgi:hypothetical protein
VAKPLAVVPDLELELDRLYSLAPSEFTSERNDLARRLKQAGRDDAAAEVKQLRKPTVPVWVVNQLARGHRDELAALLQASEQLRAAQGSALEGSEANKLRQATTAQREALQTLTHQAHDLLTSAGQSATSQTIERIASTLRAAALEPKSRELLERGRMSEELDPSGFDAFAGMPLPKRRGVVAQRAKKPDDRRSKERPRKLREQSRKAEAAARKAEQQAKHAEAEAVAARQAAERARAELESEQKPE